MWKTVELFNRKVTVTNGKLGDYANAYGTTKAIFYDGPIYKGKPTNVFAYIGYPSSPMPNGGFPAIVLAHGGGGCSFFEWVEYWNSKGYVAIAPDFYAQQYGNFLLQCGKAQLNPNGGPVDSGSFFNNASDFTDSWIYHSVFNIISAHNILLNDNRVNPEKIGLTGISWGSILTCIVSGIDYRFRAFAPVYGSGFLLETPGIITGENFQMPINAKEWTSYYDPISYLKNCNQPIMFSIGVNDHYFSPVLQQLSANLCQGSVYHCFRTELSHYHRWKDEEQMIHIADFFDYVFFDKKMPFDIICENVNNNRLSITLSSSNSVKQVRLCYTVSPNGLSTSWKWASELIPLSNFDSNKISLDLPVNAEYFFVEFCDGATSEFYLSTKLHFAHKK